MDNKILQKYDFDSEYGFIIKHPEKDLCDYFQQWRNLVINITNLRENPEEFIKEISMLPVLETDKLEVKDERLKSFTKPKKLLDTNYNHGSLV